MGEGQPCVQSLHIIMHILKDVARQSFAGISHDRFQNQVQRSSDIWCHGQATCATDKRVFELARALSSLYAEHDQPRVISLTPFKCYDPMLQPIIAVV